MNHKYVDNDLVDGWCGNKGIPRELAKGEAALRSCLIRLEYSYLAMDKLHVVEMNL